MTVGLLVFWKKNIVSKSEKGKKLVSEEKRKEIDSSVAFHLGRLGSEFENNMLDENAVETWTKRTLWSTQTI